jgi:alpha-aminoadipate carrier protein LysW
MATCPNCEALDLEVDEYELEEGDNVTCPDCGASLVVASIVPLELELVSEDEDEDDEDDDDDDLDEDDDEDRESDDEDEERGGWDE